MIEATLADLVRINAWGRRDTGQEVDFSQFLGFGLNVCLIEGEGGAIFVWRGPGIYEVHLFLEQRGKAAFELIRQMLAHMRSKGARTFWAAIPTESRHVIMFTRLLGWKSHGEADFPHGRCEIFSGE